ncbi:SWIRM-domain-containing protein [Rhizoclosmatium globosum]|uniref:SWIRM-domain-containing protein n=1 Tax=Rhizoclosmatium globosum TaxID=329046 RepID=A0A1Y2BUX8_9FUNG|nr:SWIRM-domain-containing protein [Rhizoclosmatium globosum]|eukprot:ORY38559.1 SWIRM-domain-containing protein [Rhizoclosmatium globosum]
MPTTGDAAQGGSNQPGSTNTAANEGLKLGKGTGGTGAGSGEARKDLKMDPTSKQGQQVNNVDVDTKDGSSNEAPPKLPPVFAVPRAQILAKQTHEIIIPSHAAWFTFHKIHPVEKRSLPEFFNKLHPSKTPELYQSHRNFMVNSFRMNPGEYLTITAVRRNLVGDVACVIRIHAFLEQWGLINYQIEPDARPSLVGPTFHGHFRITAHTPVLPFQPNGVTPAGKPSQESSKPIIPFSSASKQLVQKETTPTPSAPSLDVQKKKDEANLTRLKARLQTIQDQRAQRYRRAPPTNCSSCGVLCGRSATLSKENTNSSTTVSAGKKSLVSHRAAGTAPPDSRWHCLKTPTLDVCGSCYNDGRFPATLLSSDFVQLGHTPAPEDLALTKLSDPEVARRALLDEEDELSIDLGELYDDEESGGDLQLPWTQEELFLLLEGVEHFEEDWGKIAFHIGTRRKEECVHQFLAMSIEEPYLVEGGGGGVLAYRGATEMLHGIAPEERGRKRKDLKPIWPISILETLPVTPLEDPGLCVAALLVSVVDGPVVKHVAEAAIRATKRERSASPTKRSAPAGSPVKSPRVASASLHAPPDIDIGLEVKAAELHLKKLNLILSRYERKASGLENERCLVEVERRVNIVDGISRRKEVRDIQRKRQKTDVDESLNAMATDVNGSNVVNGGVNGGQYGGDSMENSEDIMSGDEEDDDGREYDDEEDDGEVLEEGDAGEMDQ